MHRVTRHQIAIVAAVLFAAGCGFKNAGTSGAGASGGSAGGKAGSGGAAGNAGGGGGGGNAGGGGRGGTSDGPMSSPDVNCGAKTKTATKLAPDVLIVLDRSGSMNESYNGTSCG